MTRLCLVMLLVASPVVSLAPLSHHHGALAQPADVSSKEAFEAAKELGTAEAWNAFLESYPSGFHADLARAYLKKLGAPAPKAEAAKEPKERSAPPAKAETAKKPAPAKKPVASEDQKGDGNSSIAGKDSDTKKGADARDDAPPPQSAGGAAIARSAKFMGFPEKFNRYYTDPDWKPSRILYVRPDGSGDGASRDTPMAVEAAMAEAAPGTEVYFLRGDYQGCFEVTGSGTYDEPIVLYGERNKDKSLGVSVKCCTSGRQTCFNFENADYIAIDGFEVSGGKFGVRVVGSGYGATEKSRGIAVLNCKGHDQLRDPFFSGQSDWAVWEGNLAFGAKKDDGHGIYLSNGGDWNIVRFNETYGNSSSDFQINADPTSTCKEVGIPFDDPRCDAYAGTDGGGQGASDYFLIDGNYFHHSNVGPNFTSVRRSVVRNNIFGPQERHNVSFWQETDNPKLGSSENKILHNLFITTDRHGVKFENSSTNNEFVNNIVLGIQVNDGEVRGNPGALLMEVDEASRNNAYRGNLYVSGKFEGYEPNNDEASEQEFLPGWFAKFPTAAKDKVSGFKPTAEAPFLGKGTRSPDAPNDRNGTERGDEVDLGPIEVP